MFLRDKSPEAAKEDAAKPGKILKRRSIASILAGMLTDSLTAAHAPDFSVSMTPTKSLLFRFSALTFNAHGIHPRPSIRTRD